MTMSATAVVPGAEDGVVGSDDTTRPRRRRFSAEYKLAIVEEYDGLSESGAKGALLRREGVYSSHIVEWRRARDVGALSALAPRVRASTRGPEHAELERANKRIARLESELAKTRAALDVVGKAHALLELLSESAEPETGSTR